MCSAQRLGLPTTPPIQSLSWAVAVQHRRSHFHAPISTHNQSLAGWLTLQTPQQLAADGVGFSGPSHTPSASEPEGGCKSTAKGAAAAATLCDTLVTPPISRKEASEAV